MAELTFLIDFILPLLTLAVYLATNLAKCDVWHYPNEECEYKDFYTDKIARNLGNLI